MDKISSAEFRKRYAKLTVTTVVTVNDHPIGVWRPVDARFEDLSVTEEIQPPKDFGTQGWSAGLPRELSHAIQTTIQRRTREPIRIPEFRPVPKPGRKR